MTHSHNPHPEIAMPEAPRWCRQDSLVVCILFASITLFHARGLWPGQVFLPLDVINNNLPWRSGPFDVAKLQNPIIADPIYQHYPFVAHAVDEIRRGSWLLWDSLMLLGHPSFGDPMYQTFYPVFTVLSLALGVAQGLTIGYWLHALLAAFFTYGWLRAQNYTRPAAALGACAFSIGGYMLTWLETTFWVGTLSWLPGILWMAELAFRRRRLGYVALAAVMFGLAILAGQISFVVIFSFFLGAYALGRSIEYSRPGRLFLWPLMAAFLTLGIGTVLGMIQILPFLQVLAQSHRTGGVTFNPFVWRQLVTLVIPNFYGNPSTAYAYWGADNYSEATFYAGLVLFFLSLAAVFCCRRFWSYYIALLGLGLVYFCCGGPGVAWVSQLPVIQYVSLNRSIFPFPLILSLLAAETLQLKQLRLDALAASIVVILGMVAGTLYINRAESAQHFKFILPLIGQAAIILGALMCLLVARGRWLRFREALTWAIVGLAFVDLFLWGAHYNPALPISSFPPATPGMQYLQARDDTYRVLTKQESGEFLFGPNVLSAFGVSDLSFYASVLPASVRNLIIAGDPGSLGYHRNVIVFGRPSLRLVDLLQAGYLASQGPLSDPGVRTELSPGDCSSQTEEIRQGSVTRGQFVVQHFAINRLDVPFRVDPGDYPGAIFTMRMWEGVAEDRLVLEQSFTRDEIRTNQQLMTFYFAPEVTAPGQTYVWEISSDAPASGVHVCAGTDGATHLGVYGVDWLQVYNSEFTITQRTMPLPRAYVVYAGEVISDETQAIGRLLDDNFDVRNIAITSQPLLPAASATGLKATPAEIQVYKNQDVVIRATALQRGLLVLGDYYYPEWEVLVDHQPATMVRANLIWRGVELSPGVHEVEFRFFPRSLKIGLWLSGAGILGLIGLGLIQCRARFVVAKKQ